MPVICLAMALGAALRAVGDAKLSMFSTLCGGGINLVFDPIFIFLFAMGIEGAALASVLARVAVLGVSAWGVFVKHRLTGQFDVSAFKQDLAAIFAVAGPAMMTNIATPVGNVVVTRGIADFGDSFVAAWAVLGRLIPVAFGMIFALSGAIGPIVGQNYGARRFDRIRESLTKAIQFCAAYVVCLSICLFIFKEQVIVIFAMKGEGAELIRFFCTYIAVFFVFSGALFVANASFNNLGKAKYSTFFNVGKATLGTIPFVHIGAQIGGVEGVLVGQVVGSILFGTLGVWTAYRLVDKVQTVSTEHHDIAEVIDEELSPSSPNPLSSSCAQMAQITEEQDCVASSDMTQLVAGGKDD